MSKTGLDGYHQWATIPLDRKPLYSVVIPAYNEAWRVIPTIGAIATYMSSLGEPWEMIVADDGSTDETASLVADLELANLHLLTGTPNGGKGNAVRRGMLAARGDFVLFADADQSTPIEQFTDLLAEINDGADVVVGSRAAAGADVANKSAMRHLMTQGLKVLVTAGFRLPVADTQCGFKLFTAEASELLFSRQVIDDFSFDLEVLFLAKKFDLEIREVPVKWIDAPGSKVDAAKVAAKFLSDLVKIRQNDLRGRYDQVNHRLAETDRIHSQSKNSKQEGKLDEAEPATTYEPIDDADQTPASKQEVKL